MRSRHVVTILSFVAGAACASPQASAPSPVAPSAAAPVAKVASSTIPGSTAKLGVIRGTVVTDPYNAVKKGVVIYLEDGPKEPGVGMAATIDNHDMEFVPFITVITAGGTVTFGNTDPFVHNAFSPEGQGWDIGQIATHAAIPKTFDSPNVYPVLCNMHKNMLGYLVVTPSSYFTKADADGHYVLNVPPGNYRVTAWSPRLKPTTQPVTATESEVTLNFELHR
jgi:plastocyanin